MDGPGDGMVGVASGGPTPPRLLRVVGVSAWLVVGIALLLAGLFWALATAATIVGPLVAGSIVATVTSPIVARLHRHGLGRGWGALVVVLLLVGLAVVIALLVLSGISSQGDTISNTLRDASKTLESWLHDLGVPASDAETTRTSVSAAAPKLVLGLAAGFVAGIRGIASIALGVSFTVFSVFFLLKDGPKLRRFVERHVGLPAATAQVVVRNVIRSIRGYFTGVTLVASFNAAVVAIGALILNVPLPGTIAIVTFVTAYIPFVGAFVSGAFAVLLALGANGTTTALLMLVVVLLANGLLQNIVSPFAMGAALDINPLLSLVVTIASGCLFGMFGLILAAPLTAASLHVLQDLRRAREEAQTSPSSTPLATASPREETPSLR